MQRGDRAVPTCGGEISILTALNARVRYGDQSFEFPLTKTPEEMRAAEVAERLLGHPTGTCIKLNGRWIPVEAVNVSVRNGAVIDVSEHGNPHPQVIPEPVGGFAVEVTIPASQLNDGRCLAGAMFRDVELRIPDRTIVMDAFVATIGTYRDEYQQRIFATLKLISTGPVSVSGL